MTVVIREGISLKEEIRLADMFEPLKHTTTLRFQETTWERLNAQAALNCIDRSALIRFLVRVGAREAFGIDITQPASERVRD